MTDIQKELRKELIAQGFSDELEAPHGSMGMVEDYATAEQLAELLDTLVARREKIFRSVPVVGETAARNSYDDVVLAINAVKALIGRLKL